MSGFDTAHTASTRSISWFCTADTACTPQVIRGSIAASPRSGLGAYRQYRQYLGSADTDKQYSILPVLRNIRSVKYSQYCPVYSESEACWELGASVKTVIFTYVRVRVSHVLTIPRERHTAVFLLSSFRSCSISTLLVQSAYPTAAAATALYSTPSVRCMSTSPVRTSLILESGNVQK